MNNDNIDLEEDSFSFMELVQQVKYWFFVLLRKWYIILIVAICGAGLGYYYASSKPVLYTAKTSFVVEESKTASGLSSFAGQLGVDFGVGSGATLITGENLLMFLRSKSLTREVLLNPVSTANSTSLADLYLETYGFKEAWSTLPDFKDKSYFPVKANKSLTRVQDSLLQIIVSNIIDKELVIERPEKKASFVNAEVSTRSEEFSALFIQGLVETAIQRYINSKTKRQQTNVNRLQRRADSLEALLNSKTLVYASQQEDLLDINPASKKITVPAELSSRDKLMLLTIFSEVTKNLEIAKVQLNQETPSIQFVDMVIFPLPKVQKSKFKFFLIGGTVFGFLAIGAIFLFTYMKTNKVL